MDIKGIKTKQTKTLLRSKNAKVKDPPRYPRVINGYEDKSKRSFSAQMNLMLADLTKEMVNLKKKK